MLGEQARQPFGRSKKISFIAKRYDNKPPIPTECYAFNPV